ncbi:hypothetical protein CAPTEDRAFT_203096 [Capitella teleta]|uniref:Uncharacterized protein n=1 Tax=Capitella teleta TaxID=283909 RepID=R7UXH6_CAPTE|nr:hypothetical protein CAPTEDRAFT_203096 [Capitella teleta]|eukprot:ELU10997.1 hypothetical protein CAPTEDRAFT_203096 [Capitella teleta]
MIIQKKKAAVKLIRHEIITRNKDRLQQLDDKQRNKMSRLIKKEGVQSIPEFSKLSPEVIELLEDEIVGRKFYHYFTEGGARKLFTGLVLDELAKGKLKIKYIGEEDAVITYET